jgi:hypothetical protein
MVDAVYKEIREEEKKGRAAEEEKAPDARGPGKPSFIADHQFDYAPDPFGEVASRCLSLFWTVSSFNTIVFFAQALRDELLRVPLDPPRDLFEPAHLQRNSNIRSIRSSSAICLFPLDFMPRHFTNTERFCRQPKRVMPAVLWFRMTIPSCYDSIKRESMNSKTSIGPDVTNLLRASSRCLLRQHTHILGKCTHMISSLNGSLNRHSRPAHTPCAGYRPALFCTVVRHHRGQLQTPPYVSLSARSCEFPCILQYGLPVLWASFGLFIVCFLGPVLACILKGAWTPPHNVDHLHRHEIDAARAYRHDECEMQSLSPYNQRINVDYDVYVAKLLS